MLQKVCRNLWKIRFIASGKGAEFCGRGNLRKFFCTDPFPNDPISVLLSLLPKKNVKMIAIKFPKCFPRFALTFLVPSWEAKKSSRKFPQILPFREISNSSQISPRNSKTYFCRHGNPWRRQKNKTNWVCALQDLDWSNLPFSKRKSNIFCFLKRTSGCHLGVVLPHLPYEIFRANFHRFWSICSADRVCRLVDNLVSSQQILVMLSSFSQL